MSIKFISDPQEKLSPLQWLVLKKFFSSPMSAPFFLTGGTALAGFYFGHRISVDLDLFTLQSLNAADLKNCFNKIADSLGGGYRVQTEAGTILTGWIETKKDKLKIDLVRDVPAHFGEMQVFEAIRFDSLENIGSNKITAIYGRTEAKDYIDLYWILENYREGGFDKLLEMAKKKDLGITDFNLGHILLAFSGFQNLPETIPEISEQKIKSYFKQIGNRLLKRSEAPKWG